MHPEEVSGTPVDGQAPVHLLWSGGWDSTSRLLELLLLRERTVRPHYVIDPRRRSVGHELRAMAAIRQLLLERFPQCESRLLPTTYRARQDIQPNAGISDAFDRLNARFGRQLGDQYGWLALYAHEDPSRSLELSLPRSVARERLMYRGRGMHQLLGPVAVREEDETGAFYRIPDQPLDADLTVLRPFRFVYFDLTKLDLEAIARANGYTDLLELTWFCHRPRPDGTPCGGCTPCDNARQGLGRRIPWSGHVRWLMLRLSGGAGKKRRPGLSLERIKRRLRRRSPAIG